MGYIDRTRVDAFDQCESLRPNLGPLNHVALNVVDVSACERFYCDVLGMRVVWRPDPDNVYLSRGGDNVALHRSASLESSARQRLDHIGFSLENANAVVAWYHFLSARGVDVTRPRAHRDGSRSVYCTDPNGTRVQLLYTPRAAA